MTGLDLNRRLLEALAERDTLKTELDRIAADKAYLFRANIANEWEERFESQERRLEMKNEELAAARSLLELIRTKLEEAGGTLDEKLQRQIIHDLQADIRQGTDNALTYWREELAAAQSEAQDLRNRLTDAEASNERWKERYQRQEGQAAAIGEQLEGDRTKVADCLSRANHAIASRDWLTEGRGSYEWNDDRWHAEFAAAADEIKEALAPLTKIAADWKFCPKTAAEVAKARLDLQAELATLRQRADRLTRAIDPMSETPATERSIESLEAWADALWKAVEFARAALARTWRARPAQIQPPSTKHRPRPPAIRCCARSPGSRSSDR